jgi:hypothetical protein
MPPAHRTTAVWMLRPEYRPWPSANAAQLLWFRIVGAALHQTAHVVLKYLPVSLSKLSKRIKLPPRIESGNLYFSERGFYG